MTKRILSVLLAVMMILTVIPASLSFAETLGDIDGNDSITAADARLALRASVGLETLSPEQTAAADADFNGTITAADARLILRASVGLETLHTHSYTEKVTKKATCTEKGTKTFTCECGDSYTEEIPATGHTSVTDKAVAPTCTVAGKTEGSHCSICGVTLKAQTAVAAKGHTPVLDNSTVKAVTCKGNGYTGDYKCSVCGTVTKTGSVITATGNEHEMTRITVEASCTQDGYSILKCKYCDTYDENSVLPGEKAKNHSWGTPKVVAPKCNEQGYTVKTCSACKAEEKYDLTAALTHDYKWNTTQRASCQQTGSKTGTCKLCGNITTETIPLQACKPASSSVKITGSEDTPCKLAVKCTVCTKVISEYVSDSAHTVDVAVTQSESCTEPRLVTHTCKYCNYAKENVVAADPLGHTMTPTSRTPAKCEEDGEIVYSGHCDRCNTTFAETKVVLKAKGHNLVGTQTCTTAVTCTVCHEDIQPKLGHDYTLQAETYNTEIHTFFCKRCGASNENDIETFNGIVNNLKKSSYYLKDPYINYFDKTSVSTEYTRFDFGIYTSAIRDLYEEEMSKNSDEYSSVRYSHILYSLPLTENNNGTNIVSLLTSSDVDSVQIEKLSGVKFADVLSIYSPSYTNESQIQRFNAIKSTVVNKEVIKVTIDVRDESYQSVKNLPENQDTSLQKIYDFDIRADADAFETNDKGELIMTETEKGDGYEISMEMKLSNIKSDATVTYYFDAETYEPIIAVYDTDIMMEQTINMKFKIGIFSLNGELDPVISTNYTRAYIFPEYAVQ